MSMHKMRHLFLLTIFLLTSCSGGPEIKGAFINNECKSIPMKLSVIKSASIEEVDSELKRIYQRGIPEPIIEEFNSLKSELSNGGGLYEITSDKKSWQALYGSWGYGVVRNDCLVSYLQLVVS